VSPWFKRIFAVWYPTPRLAPVTRATEEEEERLQGVQPQHVETGQQASDSRCPLPRVERMVHGVARGLQQKREVRRWDAILGADRAGGVVCCMLYVVS
jgi:hypothetical protein